MGVPWVLLKCVAKAAVKNIANLVSFGFAGDLIVDTWDYWQKQTQEQERKEELQQLAQAAAKEVRDHVKQVIMAEAGLLPQEQRQQLESYLMEVPAMIRRTARRSSDPSGRTIPAGVVLRKADDLVPFLPPKLSRFKIGDRPLPAVDWELEELLGIGGFGEVWKAKNPHFDGVPPVALKFCLDTTAKDRLLKHEAAVLNQVMRQGKHQGIIGLERTYLGADPPCLEYEYIEGGDLAGLLAECRSPRGGMSPEQATRIVLRLSEIVQYTHQLKPPIVHRDLKPANILVQAKGGTCSFKVADFGIGGLAIGQAIAQTRLGTVREAIVGTMLRGAYTPLYASPQQMSGQSPDPRDDVYALGVIWYQLLMGDLTSGAPTGLAWADELQDAGLSKPLVYLLGSCVATKPDSRPADAGVLAQQIAAHIQATPRRATPPPIPRDEPEEIPKVIPVEPLPVVKPAPYVLPVSMSSSSPAAIPVVKKVPAWFTTAEEMADATYRFWLLGYANEFAPTYQKIAQSQGRGDFIRDILGLAQFLMRHDFPIFQGEAMIGGGIDSSMRLTTYRMIITSPYGEVLCFPLHTVARYSFIDSTDREQGTVISIKRTDGETVRWDSKRDPIGKLIFPRESFVKPLLRMQLWTHLPAEALPQLACTNEQLRRK